MSIEGRKAFVTGAGRGIGRAIALRLARDGADVAVNDLQPETARTTAGEIEALGRASVAVPGDVTERSTASEMAAAAARSLGGLDVLVNNAGIVQVKPLVEVEPAELEQLFRVNVFGVVYGIQAAYGALGIRVPLGVLGDEVRRRRPDPGRREGAGRSPDHRQRLLPGIVGTDMWEHIDDRLGGYLGLGKGEARSRYAHDAVLDRVQTPEEVASLVSYLAGPDSDFMTGQSVVIDGGIVMA